ncbi:ubiquitin carboxyl-terminal hydrolase [Parashewanella tropica]|uniref:ubiquitin carboxyl-terminal hydrolase n=1 Tax=Parashewanella tropica TaxID=2547970 RepID=UPI001059E75B|nr:ubiquitin carboxyl-terminal hydrolase family protein [Parashewanella tropica]
MDPLGKKTDLVSHSYDATVDDFAQNNDKNLTEDVQSFAQIWTPDIKPALPKEFEEKELRIKLSQAFQAALEAETKDVAEQAIAQVNQRCDGRLKLELEFYRRYGKNDGYTLVLKNQNGSDVQRFKHVKVELNPPQASPCAAGVKSQEPLQESDLTLALDSDFYVPTTDDLNVAGTWELMNQDISIFEPKYSVETLNQVQASSPKAKGGLKTKGAAKKSETPVARKKDKEKQNQKPKVSTPPLRQPTVQLKHPEVVYSEQLPDPRTPVNMTKQVLKEKLMQGGLVKSKEHFDALFSRVDVSLYSEQQLAHWLAIYQKVQPVQPEDLLDEYFGLALDAPYFDLSINQIGNAINTLDIVAKSTYTQITGKINIVPKTSEASKVIARGVKPKAAGLYNWGNTCFMNSGLQLLGIHLKSTEILEELKHGIPSAAVKDIVLTALPPIDFSSVPKVLCIEELERREEVIQLERAEYIDRWTKNICEMSEEELVSKPIILPEYPDVDINAKLNALMNFKSEFVKLLERLQMDVTVPTEIVSPAQQQQDFLEAYYHFAEATGRFISQYLLTPDFGQLRYAKIRQQDPQEFLNEVMDIMGLKVAPGNHIETVEVTHLHSSDGRRYLAQSRANTPSPLATVNLPLEGDEVTLDSYLKQYCKEEKMRKTENKRWEHSVLEQHKMTAEDVITSKQFKFYAESSPPNQFMVQLKLFEGLTEKPTCMVVDRKSGKPRKKDAGLEVIHSLLESGRKVKVSMFIGNDSQPQDIEYQVVGISCHAGDNIVSGHFTALKFNPDGSAVFLDDEVAVDWQDYYQARDITGSAQSLKEFCEQKRLSGYLFSLKRVTAE